MSNVPPPPGGGFPPPPSGPPPGGGFPPPGGPPPGGGGYPPPPGGGGFPPAGGGYPPPGGGGFQPGGFGGGPGPAGAPVEWQDRLVSGLIDYVGPFILSGIVGYLVNVVILSSSNLYISPGGWIVGLFALAWVLYNGYLAGQTGQSFGMKQSGLRLVGENDGQLIGGNQGLVRNLLLAVYWLCGCLFIVVVLDALWPLWDPKKQTLRDKIAKSIVVRA